MPTADRFSCLLPEQKAAYFPLPQIIKTKVMNLDIKFICKIQRKKMAELWDNLEDESWENV